VNDDIETAMATYLATVLRALAKAQARLAELEARRGARA
jgi:hypothetical protein